MESRAKAGALRAATGMAPAAILPASLATEVTCENRYRRS